MKSSNLMVHPWDFVKESPSLKLTVHLANGSKCTQCKGLDHVQNWKMDSLHKKSQKPIIIAPRPTRIKFNCRRINSKKAKPGLFIIRFLNGPEDSNNAMENSKDRSCHPRPHWPKDHWSIFTRWLIQPLLSQVITPQAPKPRSHPWGSSIFLLFS